MNIQQEVSKIRKQIEKVQKLKETEEKIRDELFKELFNKMKNDYNKTVAIVRTAKYELAFRKFINENIDTNEENMDSESNSP